MDSERWQRLDQIFAEARERPQETRATFIANACGEDEALRADALSLLEADSGANEFLSTSAFEKLARTVAADGWNLRPGERVGAYRIERLLGSGGSGEVWRARDDRLDRNVAIKIVLPYFVQDSQRLRLFLEEARNAGALNHHSILAVYDVGEHHGVPFLVSECLEGETLRKRLAAGPLPLDDAVAVAVAIASGLTAAHGRGIVHCDLKPENVFLRSDGGVKILDFGLAKLQRSDDGDQMRLAAMPRGVIAGTAGYMAPEQIRGEDADVRSDLFALGAMLYEMLSGRRAFRGASTVETLQAILTTEPPDITTQSPSVRPALTAIVTRLLKKTPGARFQSAADLAWALDQVARHPEGGQLARRDGGQRQDRWPRWLAISAITAAVLLGGLWLWPDDAPRPRDVPPTRFVWTLPPGMALDSPLAVSPDGRRVAFTATDGSRRRLFVRDLSSEDPSSVSGTEGAKQPFWSPDGKSIGFFAEGKLMKVAAAGGAPVTLATAPDGRGGAWSTSGMIVFAPSQIASALTKVSADGGMTQPATLLNRDLGENSHRWPVFLPDGRRFLYFVRSISDERRGIFVGDVDKPSAVPGLPLLQSDSEAAYVPPTDGRDLGDLVYVKNGRIEVRPFDATNATLAGDARVLEGRAAGATPYNASMLGASPVVIAFTSSPIPSGTRLASVKRDGTGLEVRADSEAQNWPRLSPDGRWLARQRIDAVRGNPDIWVEDLARATRVRVTTDPAADSLPVWSPDSSRLAYLVSDSPPRTPGRLRLTIATRDGTGVQQTLSCPDAYCEPTDWAPDGKYLVVNVRGGKGPDVWAIATERGGVTRALLADSYAERDARISPDGRSIAYVSEESGRPEVSVRDLSRPGSRHVISTGGDQPVWRRDGNELFFVDPEGRLRTVSVRRTNADGLHLGLAVPLDLPAIGFGHFGTQYDVTPDGKSVYFLRRNDDPPPHEVHIMMGWRTLLNRP
jgi:serine/threonine protein kinase/Tol biopolymer transport system component